MLGVNGCGRDGFFCIAIPQICGQLPRMEPTDLSHVPASLRVLYGLPTVTAMVGAAKKYARRHKGERVLTRLRIKWIEAGDMRAGMDDLRLYGAVIGRDEQTMVAAHANARTRGSVGAKAS